ncbi:ribonuclease H-like domain-containing protein [Tanacetum coccineum]
MVPRTVLTRSGLISLNAARPVNTVQPRTTVNNAGPMKNVINNAYSTARRPFNKITAANNNNFNKRVNTVNDKNVNAARPNAVVNTARPKAVLSAVKGNKGNAVKASACWVWRPKHKVLDHVSRNNGASMSFKRFDYGNPQQDLKDKGVIDSGCLGAHDRKQIYLTDEGTSKLFEINQTYVACQKGKQHRASCIETLMDLMVKVIRYDNGTEFKNRAMNQFCEMKGIKREFSVARTPQQNRVAKKKNRTLIEVVRTMLANSKLPTTFWAEAINTACYV